MVSKNKKNKKSHNHHNQAPAGISRADSTPSLSSSTPTISASKSDLGPAAQNQESKAEHPMVVENPPSTVPEAEIQASDSQPPLKHPLNSSWTLWYYEQDRSKSWEDCQHEVFKFDTVEDFWSLFNHVRQPSDIKSGTDYSLFKTGIRPQWEDEANCNGGRWMVTLQRDQRDTMFDRYWIDALMSLVGETSDCCDDICGAVVNNRNKGDKIAIWTRNRDQSVLEVGHKLKIDMNLPDDIPLQFQTHADSMNKNSSSIRTLYQI